ncbi:DUF4258 domain-containing protein [Quisquiliibacterium transsilvanicum]|uniref:Alkylation response protein AidB-like acyl-CoA dehydrogenase n=1 Tax=Quisquiliibacterium transsilvanicum TaxID=1549638 RepID=A0A7W8HFT0_9BURK|nr:DUF4258 domain-containing protein [Quisquiliibacterium transsilvanicum]MBB5271307.1 alkylation response protein AidB-like acyl-CoA dehydrogenase [Quisquiliibacterium transsilvanicum]
MAQGNIAALAFTPHARRRIQSRAIAQRAIEYVLEFGRERRSAGATKIYLDRQARQRLEREVGRTEIARLGHKLDIAVVVGDSDRVVTTMYRTRRTRH